MENSNKKLYTTHEVARLLGVTPITVIRWIVSGKFKCFTTVGGHRRIDHDELVKFAQTYNLPWRGEEEIKLRKEYVVLAVDDEPDALEMLQDMVMSMKDVRLIGVANGFTAGAKLVEEHPDLVLLDFMMPELDGFEFTRFMRQDPRFKDIPIVAVTGLKGDEEIRKMKEIGVNDVLSKPFSEAMLHSKIETFRHLKHTDRSAGSI
jgi:excisionase family DNA binding protein